MQHRHIPFTEFPQVTRLFTDYLYHYDSVSLFYPFNPASESSYKSAANEIHYPDELRKSVVSILREQNLAMSAGEKTLQNLQRLEQPGCYTVLTGQQVGLFTGPVFALYKAMTAIKKADELTQMGLPSVPIFWMATEDHDLEEVNHCFIQDRSGNPVRLQCSGAEANAGQPVGSIQFTDAIKEITASLKFHLPESEFSEELIQSVSSSYVPGENMGRAFGRLLARIFSNYGVVLVDPLDARLHRLSTNVFKKAIEEAPAIVEELIERNRLLSEMGYHHQVRVTPNTSLLFLQINGQRRALRLSDSGFTLPDGEVLNQDQILKQLNESPETITPNVLLRPVMQDALLPTIAYVGGPSELAYLAQAGPVYRRILGRMPVLLPRASFTIVDRSSNRILEKYSLTITDVFEGINVLQEKMAAKFFPADLTAIFDKTKTGLDTQLKYLRQALEKLDPTLADAAENSGRKMHYQISSLERKAVQAVQNRSEQIERDAERLANSLFPNKAPQERFYGGISLLARHGPQFLDTIYQNIAPCSDHHKLLAI
ncbi:MAG: bacillithiol biosynthesis cysteine-adding enzyme BshC [Acidobacteria bacterium RIFCSPLOWO2_12_FULL_54_10]|nr:MAG: bacillithiol biosynthesis cysteine-adding enzyme BshC [Acidobacteria bacterium RIFCSPLOWO2_12_FULL_54_10]